MDAATTSTADEPASREAAALPRASWSSVGARSGSDSARDTAKASCTAERAAAPCPRAATTRSRGPACVSRVRAAIRTERPTPRALAKYAAACVRPCGGAAAPWEVAIGGSGGVEQRVGDGGEQPRGRREGRRGGAIREVLPAACVVVAAASGVVAAPAALASSLLARGQRGERQIVKQPEGRTRGSAESTRDTAHPPAIAHRRLQRRLPCRVGRLLLRLLLRLCLRRRSGRRSLRVHRHHRRRGALSVVQRSFAPVNHRKRGSTLPTSLTNRALALASSSATSAAAAPTAAPAVALCDALGERGGQVRSESSSAVRALPPRGGASPYSSRECSCGAHASTGDSVAGEGTPGEAEAEATEEEAEEEGLVTTRAEDPAAAEGLRAWRQRGASCPAPTESQTRRGIRRGGAPQEEWSRPGVHRPLRRTGEAAACWRGRRGGAEHRGEGAVQRTRRLAQRRLLPVLLRILRAGGGCS